MDAPAAEMTSPNGATSPEDNDTPHVYSEMRTPTQPTVSVDMPDFDEACMLALDAAMARHKEPTAGDVAAGEDMTFGTVTSSATHVVEDAVLTSSIVNSKNDLMVNLSDEEELELDFEEFDSL